MSDVRCPVCNAYMKENNFFCSAKCFKTSKGVSDDVSILDILKKEGVLKDG